MMKFKLCRLSYRGSNTGRALWDACILLEETPKNLSLAMENGGFAMDRPPKSEVGSLFKRFLSHSTLKGTR